MASNSEDYVNNNRREVVINLIRHDATVSDEVIIEHVIAVHCGVRSTTCVFGYTIKVLL